MENFNIEEFEKLTNQIKEENPTIDIEICKYLAGSYLMYDVMKIEKPTDDLEAFVKANKAIELASCAA